MTQNEKTLDSQSDQIGEVMEELVLSPTGEEESSGVSRLIPLSSDQVDGSYKRPMANDSFYFRDPLFTGIFIIHVLLSIAISEFIRDNNELGDTNSSNRNIATKLHSVSAVTTMFSFVWLSLFVFVPRNQFLKASSAFSLTCLLIYGIRLFFLRYTSATLFGLIFAIALLFDVNWTFKSRNRMEFTAVLFELIIEFFSKFSSMALLTIGLLIVYTSWACWIGTTVAALNENDSPWQFSMLVLYFHFYWTSNVFKYVLTVVVAGSTAVWYFEDDSSRIARDNISVHEIDRKSDPIQWRRLVTANHKVILQYLRCSITTSFGSICIGALLCPIVEILQTYLKWLECVKVSFIKRFSASQSAKLSEFIHAYHPFAFAHIAAHGKPFSLAAQDTWNLIDNQGVEGIIADDLTSKFLVLNAKGWAALMSTLCSFAFRESNHEVFLTLLSFILSYSILSIVMRVIGAVVDTLCICFAESPSQLTQLHPIIYHRFVRLSEVKTFRDHKAPLNGI
uniref:Choline transporter-like protein n=1 Tax=Albugo laibachii Nc14 TaxID=890382 RepID=F0W8U6_9STRA|nr:transmembrane protein putative [Albugo laibachii Nc14]|eukprot:CCA17555.1 transmembrane protein putative [Albugo laibachii Nc14]